MWGRTVTFGRTYLSEVNEDRLLGLSAEVAFFSVLSLFPGLLVATSLLGLLDQVVGPDVAGRVQHQVTDALSMVLSSRAGGTIDSVKSLFDHGHGGLLTVATLGALVSLSGAFAVVVEALNLAYDTEERRSWLHRRLLGLLLAVATMLVVVLALAVVVVGPLLGKGQDVASTVGLGAAFARVWNLARLPVLFLAMTLWVMALFRYAPSRRTSWLRCLPGAVTTSGLWLAATAGFHLYLRLVGSANPVIGAFGGGVIVMTWVYLLSLALLAGGELNATLADHRHQPTQARTRSSERSRS